MGSKRQLSEKLPRPVRPKSAARRTTTFSTVVRLGSANGRQRARSRTNRDRRRNDSLSGQRPTTHYTTNLPSVGKQRRAPVGQPQIVDRL